MYFYHSGKTQKLIEKLNSFMDEFIYPNETTYSSQISKFRDEGNPWQAVPILEELKEIAKDKNLWNFFLTTSEYGCGLTNLEYAPLAEIMGRVGWSSEVFNCSAPDTGNMEVLERYGTEEQKEKWLKPLLEGKIRSCFAMTEPSVASSDATNISSTIELDGDSYVINGEKWWASGVGHPNCKLLIFMGVSNPDNPKHQRQSQIIVPFDSPGIKLKKYLTVYGADHAPNGHGHLMFKDVRVPKENIILGEGRGFEIAQGRLGPGRIHHCMRIIGLAERALGILCKRALSRKAFGKTLSELGGNYDVIANSRIELEKCRLATLKAAFMMDRYGNKAAKSEIAQTKVSVPFMAINIIDAAIQIHGAEGLSQDSILPSLYQSTRYLRIGDGPDEVHKRTIAKNEISMSVR
jgi:acyl-CoA dehydrogenase|tara:strand:- start:2839 stop:4056 length:1218 start_codon:yes stop_codon:yes gene_type:complete